MYNMQDTSYLSEAMQTLATNQVTTSQKDITDNFPFFSSFLMFSFWFQASFNLPLYPSSSNNTNVIIGTKLWLLCPTMLKKKTKNIPRSPAIIFVYFLSCFIAFHLCFAIQVMTHKMHILCNAVINQTPDRSTIYHRASHSPCRTKEQK